MQAANAAELAYLQDATGAMLREDVARLRAFADELREYAMSLCDAERHRAAMLTGVPPPFPAFSTVP